MGQDVEAVADVVELVEQDVVAASAQKPASDLRSVGSKRTSNSRAPLRKRLEVGRDQRPGGVGLAADRPVGPERDQRATRGATSTSASSGFSILISLPSRRRKVSLE